MKWLSDVVDLLKFLILYFISFFRKSFLSAFFFIISCILINHHVKAFDFYSNYGIHLLNPYEIDEAIKLLKVSYYDKYHFVTIPISLSELNKNDEWQSFCHKAYFNQIIPIFRLTTKFENGNWQIPNRKEIISLLDFIKNLNCKHDGIYIIVFNEVNHAKEWGGKIDPISYAEILKFTYNWAKTETDINFLILPAGFDLAADGRNNTMEAFNYLEQMYAYDSEIFYYFDYWNSHSYPNPGFVSDPLRKAKNSLSGFKYELDYLQGKTKQEIKVFITETGWMLNSKTKKVLTGYYQQAHNLIWSDERIVAITPFLLKGSPGIFNAFSFLDIKNQPTLHYQSYRKIIELESKEFNSEN